MGAERVAVMTEWAFSVCVAAVVGAAAEMFSPEGSTKRIFKLCVTVFFICCLFSPLLGIAADIIQNEDFADEFINGQADEWMSEENSLDKEYGQYVVDEFKRNIEDIVRDALKEIKINNAEVEVSVNIDADNCISITEVEVILSEDVRELGADVAFAIKKRIGTTPNIYFK